jgi:uncharacterized membrane protein
MAFIIATLHAQFQPVSDKIFTQPQLVTGAIKIGIIAVVCTLVALIFANNAFPILPGLNGIPNNVAAILLLSIGTLLILDLIFLAIHLARYIMRTRKENPHHSQETSSEESSSESSENEIILSEKKEVVTSAEEDKILLQMVQSVQIELKDQFIQTEEMKVGFSKIMSYLKVVSEVVAKYPKVGQEITKEAQKQNVPMFIFSAV